MKSFAKIRQSITAGSHQPPFEDVIRWIELQTTYRFAKAERVTSERTRDKLYADCVQLVGLWHRLFGEAWE